MIIDWDTDVAWNIAPIDFVTDASKGSYQNYYYRELSRQQLPDEPPRRRLLLAVADEVYDAIGQVVGNLYHYSGGPRLYEAEMVELDGSRHPDFCMPSQAGYQHLQLIITGIAPDDAKATMTLAQVIELAPIIGAESKRKPYRGNQIVVNLPPSVWEIAKRLALIHFGKDPKSMDDFIAMCIYNMAEDLL